jgi:hypothetical protein
MVEIFTSSSSSSSSSSSKNSLNIYKKKVLTVKLYKYNWKTVPPVLQAGTWYPAII